MKPFVLSSELKA